MGLLTLVRTCSRRGAERRASRNSHSQWSEKNGPTTAEGMGGAGAESAATGPGSRRVAPS
eukprot:8175438-Lingulodinium_polyedra.AAC.1